MHRHLAKVSAAAVTIIVVAVLILFGGYTPDLIWLVGPIAALAWVTYQLTTASIQRRAPGQQTISVGSLETAVLIGSLLAIIVGFIVIRSRQDRSSSGGSGATSPTAPTPAAPAPPPVLDDTVVVDFLESHLAPGWEQLPVAIHPLDPLLKDRDNVFTAGPYNAAKNGVMLTLIDLSLYDGARLEAKMITPKATPIDFECGAAGKLDFYYYPNVTRFDLDATVGSVQLLPTDKPPDENVLVEFTLKLPPVHSVWCKTDLVTDGTPNDPSLEPGWVYWGRIPLTLQGVSLQRVVVNAEVRHPDAAGILLTATDLQGMPKAPALALQGSSGSPQQRKEVLFKAGGIERLTTNEAMLTDEYCDVYIRTPTDRQLRWRVSVRCDWAPGT